MNNAAEKEEKPPSYLANKFDLWALGVAVVIGGQLYGWNAGFGSGFGYYAIAQILMGMAYIVLVLCIVEVSSSLQFSGGCYGLARVVVGFYPGFLVGYLQLIEFTVYTSSAVLFVSDTIVSSCEISVYYTPLFTLILYVIMVGAVNHDDQSMWTFSKFIAILSLILIAIYVLASYGWVHFDRYAGLTDDTVNRNNAWFNGGFSSFIRVFPLTTWSYGGIESLALTLSNLNEPITTFRDGSIAAVLTLFVSNILLLFSWACQPPGISSTLTLEFPMSPIYTAVFHWPVVVSNLLTLPGNVAMAYGFVYPSGKLLQSLSNSNLVPMIFNLSSQDNPKRAVIYCAVFGYIICLIGLFIPNFSNTLSSICILTAYMTYFSILYGFAMMRIKFDFIEAKFKSPVGIPGAIFASVIFGLGFISSIGFQDDHYITVIITTILIFLLTIYYYGFAMKDQKLSVDEHKSVFRLHVVKYNTNRRSAGSSGLNRSSNSRGHRSHSKSESVGVLIRNESRKILSVSKVYDVSVVEKFVDA